MISKASKRLWRFLKGGSTKQRLRRLKRIPAGKFPTDKFYREDIKARARNKVLAAGGVGGAVGGGYLIDGKGDPTYEEEQKYKVPVSKATKRRYNKFVKNHPNYKYIKGKGWLHTNDKAVNKLLDSAQGEVKDLSKRTTKEDARFLKREMDKSKAGTGNISTKAADRARDEIISTPGSTQHKIVSKHLAGDDEKGSLGTRGSLEGKEIRRQKAVLKQRLARMTDATWKERHPGISRRAILAHLDAPDKTQLDQKHRLALEQNKTITHKGRASARETALKTAANKQKDYYKTVYNNALKDNTPAGARSVAKNLTTKKFQPKKKREPVLAASEIRVDDSGNRVKEGGKVVKAVDAGYAWSETKGRWKKIKKIQSTAGLKKNINTSQGTPEGGVVRVSEGGKRPGKLPFDVSKKTRYHRKTQDPETGKVSNVKGRVKGSPKQEVHIQGSAAVAKAQGKMKGLMKRARKKKERQRRKDTDRNYRKTEEEAFRAHKKDPKNLPGAKSGKYASGRKKKKFTIQVTGPNKDAKPIIDPDSGLTIGTRLPKDFWKKRGRSGPPELRLERRRRIIELATREAKRRVAIGGGIGGLVGAESARRFIKDVSLRHGQWGKRRGGHLDDPKKLVPVDSTGRGGREWISKKKPRGPKGHRPRNLNPWTKKRPSGFGTLVGSRALGRVLAGLGVGVLTGAGYHAYKKRDKKTKSRKTAKRDR